MVTKVEKRDGFRKQETYYRWNGKNELVSITTPKGDVWHYKYDALGRRIAKECPQQHLRIEYLWDGDQIAFTRTFKNDEIVSERHSVFNGFELVAQQDNYQTLKQTIDGNFIEWKQETGYAICQPNGQVLALLNPQGKTLWRKEKHSLWGLLFPNDYRKTTPLDPQMLFAGQWFDEESGLAYNRFRYYDPETGNYISSDPIGLQGGETPYGYVHNPMDWVDLFGLLKEFGIAPYSSILHRNDGLDAHELLQNAWLEQNGLAKRGSGLSRKNPAIAINNDPLYKSINHLQRKYGLHDSATLRKQSALSNINKNAALTRRAIAEDLVGKGIDKRAAKSLATKYVNDLRSQTIDFVKANNIISCRG